MQVATSNVCAGPSESTTPGNNVERVRFNIEGKWVGMQPINESDAACLERDILRQDGFPPQPQP